MPLRTPEIQAYWPTTQSLDLVETSAEAAANAISLEVRRFSAPEPVQLEHKPFRTLKEAFASCLEFTNVPTYLLVLPTRSRWSVIWNNSTICDGYDSLCHCLSRRHGMTTMHWSAHDEATTFQPGSRFTFRRANGENVIERTVHCGREDGRWSFHAAGVPLIEEDTVAYEARLKSARLNEHSVAALLARLGARPWEQSFYDLENQGCYVVRRTHPPASLTRRLPRQVLVAA